MPPSYDRPDGTSLPSDSLEREVREEFAFHLEEKESDLVAAGFPYDEARRRALQEFGSVERWCRESVRARREAPGAVEVRSG